MRFAAWKVIQCYYAVFSAVAAIVTASKPERKSHNATLNIFAREFLCSRSLKSCFIPPSNFYLNQQGQLPEDLSKQVNWGYADSYHIPNIVKGLTSVRKENQAASIPHYLKNLRDWVTYGDSYLFIRLFGKSPKTTLDSSLQSITTLFCVEAEYFLLRLYGLESVNRQFQYFSHQLETSLGTKPEALTTRFDIYRASFL